MKIFGGLILTIILIIVFIYFISLKDFMDQRPLFLRTMKYPSGEFYDLGIQMRYFAINRIKNETKRKESLNNFIQKLKTDYTQAWHEGRMFSFPDLVVLLYQNLDIVPPYIKAEVVNQMSKENKEMVLNKLTCSFATSFPTGPLSFFGELDKESKEIAAVYETQYKFKFYKEV